MTPTQIYKMKGYIQPFERSLALKELASLTGGSVKPVDRPDRPSNDFIARDLGDEGVKKLAYWERIGNEDRLTVQVRREATLSIARNGIPLNLISKLSENDISERMPRKRCLRYGTHGIHEYRGKFFPQLVKSLINISGASPGGLVVDPMCGSGTTVVEAALHGNQGRGIDMNPLSVMISRVKFESLRATPEQVIACLAELQSALPFDDNVRIRVRPTKDAAYIAQWFSSNVLIELEAISHAIERLSVGSLRDFYKICLSNIIREVSLQKEADLRVRREDKIIPVGYTTRAFFEESMRSSRSLVAFLAHGSISDMGTGSVVSGDARTFCTNGLVEPGSADVVITSPPYATALPYLDTDRLSLIYFDLLQRSEHRKHDHFMIGNREVTEKNRKALWEHYESQRHLLPNTVTDLIDKVESENSQADVGFRRKNLGALLGKYFCDMRKVIEETNKCLRPGAPAFFVVGNNRTNLPSGEIEIKTAHLLLDIAKSVGFDDCHSDPMEMLSSRDLFSKNQTPSEHILRMVRQK